MEKNETTQVEGHCFISTEQRLMIQELKELCFFDNVAQRKHFLKTVSKSCGVDKIELIKSADFGTAYLTALAILHKVGESVFKPQTGREDGDLFFGMGISKRWNT